MRRKVIQIADSTQLISLPRKWCIDRGIKKGDELEVNAVGNRILVSTEKDTGGDSIEVDASELDRTSIINLIRGLYKKGFDEIKIISKKSSAHHFRTGKDISFSTILHKEASRCPGLEIIEQKEAYCVLRVISNAEPKELENILRRTFIILVDTCKDLIEGAKRNDTALLESIEEKHDNATRFINHTLRLINKRDEGTKNTYLLYQIISMLDKILDSLKNAARDALIFNKKASPETAAVLDLIYESYVVFQDLFYKFTIEKVRHLSELKEEIHRTIVSKVKTIPKEELLLLYELHQSLELYKALAEARMAMEY